MGFAGVLQLTEELIRINSQLMERYEKIKSSGESADFYEEVKPFADSVKTLSEQWLQEVSKWMDCTRPSGIHINQIQHTVENIQDASIRSFFPTTNKMELLKYIRSNSYVLKSVQNKLVNHLDEGILK